jgi:chromosome segregation ATPase
MSAATLAGFLAMAALVGAGSAFFVGEILGPAVPTATPPLAPDAPAGDDVPSRRALAALLARVDALDANLAAARAEAASLKEGAGEVTARAAALSGRMEEMARREALGGEFTTWEGVGVDGQRAVTEVDNEARQARMRSVQALRRKSEAERWTAARDALGLTPQQEEQLQAALRARSEGLRDALTEVAPGDGGLALRAADPVKARAARATYDEALSAVLTAEQKRRWQEEGYEDALRGTLPGMRAGGRPRKVDGDR